MPIDSYSLPFASVVRTARGPALLIDGEVIEIRSSDSEAHAQALAEGLRRAPFGVPVPACANPASPTETDSAADAESI